MQAIDWRNAPRGVLEAKLPTVSRVPQCLVPQALCFDLIPIGSSNPLPLYGERVVSAFNGRLTSSRIREKKS